MLSHIAPKRPTSNFEEVVDIFKTKKETSISRRFSIISMVALSEVDTKNLTSLYNYTLHPIIKQTKIEALSETEPEFPTINKIQQRQKRFTEAESKKIAEAYLSGKTIYELADIFECNRETVSKHLKAQNIKLRRQPVSDEKIGQIVELYSQGNSCAKIARLLGIGSGTVWRKLTNQEIQLR